MILSRIVMKIIQILESNKLKVKLCTRFYGQSTQIII